MPIPDFDARNFVVVLLSGVVGAAACAPPRGDLGEYTDTDAPGDTTESPGESGGMSPTSTGDADEPEEPEGVSCDEGTDLNVGFNLVVFEPDITEQDFIADCTVAAIQPGPAFIFLDCPDREVRIGLGDADISRVTVGDLLRFDYRRRNLSHYENWFVLRKTDTSEGLLVAGINAAGLTPPDDPDFFAPLVLIPRESVCPTTPTCESPRQKIAVEFAHEGGAIALLPPSSATFGDVDRYRFSLGVAVNNHIELTDVPIGTCDLSNFSPYNFNLHIVLAPAE